eukprot:CAMPEP_0197898318 /NCGR_PEP_ID=MMETSP1439-20131203/43730_1 /TAXON_ID=66791 /ORGANISM="Gonyaulax spinifera, Strain CCMP409" /LENGTH=251 /DNA_ID=CAMNT_0043519025 /DNA_START=88 /DNA_END=843 /DNA_ORIENTATION=-
MAARAAIILAAVIAPCTAISAKQGEAWWSFPWPQPPKVPVPFPEEPCKCLNWSHAYTIYGMSCLDLGKDQCEVFYKKLHSNICLNGMGNRPQVCIVSSMCEDLNGGLSINGNVSSRICDPKKDKRGLELEPEEMVQMAEKFDLDIRTLMNRAYLTDHITPWQTAKFLWTSLRTVLSPDRLKVLDPVQQSNYPTIFKADPGLTTDGLVKGKMAWEILVDVKKLRRSKNRLTNPNGNAKLVCITGCNATGSLK